MRLSSNVCLLMASLLIVGSLRAADVAPPPPVAPTVTAAPVAPPAPVKLATVAEIQELMKNFPNIKVAGAGTQVFLDGTVENPIARQRVEKLAHSFNNVVDLTTYIENADANEVLAREIQQRIGFADVKVRLIRDAIVLDGEVASDADRKSAENVARAYAEKIINNLGMKRQMVEVDLAYVDIATEKVMDIRHNPLTALASPGVSVNASFSPTANYIHDATTAARINRDWTATGTATTSWVLRFLESDADTRILNRPHVTCLTGEAASFRQGGERGYEVINNQTADVKFKEFGLIINVTPNLMRDGRIQLHCYFEFSTPDPRGDRLDFLKYSTESVAVLGNAESLLVSGLVNDAAIHFKRGIPFLRRIPLLGHFFDDHQDNKTKRDLLLVITPRVPSTFAAQGESTATEQVKRVDPARIRWTEDLGGAERQLKWESKDRAKAGAEEKVEKNVKGR